MLNNVDLFGLLAAVVVGGLMIAVPVAFVVLVFRALWRVGSKR